MPRQRISSARELARHYALTAGNWSWRDYPSRLSQLAGLATGSLRQDLRRSAVDAVSDESLRRDRPASSAAVEVVRARPIRSRASVLVVTRETRSEHGTAAPEGPRYRVAVAAMAQTPRGWRVTRWEPQP